MENEKYQELSVIIPCRNEEQSLGGCILKIQEVLKNHNISGEIIVSDSSTDSSPDIARKFNVKLVKHDKEGYGNAYLEGFKVASGKYFFCADPDGTYDFEEIPKFLTPLRDNYDFVIGDRFKGNIKKGAMPWLHRYVGNPFLSFILRIFFNTEIRDTHCGMRAFKKEALEKMNLKTTGMEFASEMIIKTVKNKFKIKELPINYYPRKGKSKLKSFSDGWRHLRFMLLYSPIFLFLIPGLLFFFLGLLSMAWLYFGNPTIFGIKLFFHPMFLSSLFIIAGYQIIIFSVFAKTYAMTHLEEESSKMNFLHKYITIEKAGIAGIIIGLSGLAIFIMIFYKWTQSSFGALNEIKNSIIGLTLLIIGIQTVFSSFMLSILGIKER